MKRVIYTKRAIKDFRSIPAKFAQMIRGKIKQYAADPGSLANMVTKLRGRSGYRLRVGDYRVIFDEDGKVMTVLRIGPRGGVYE